MMMSGRDPNPGTLRIAFAVSALMFCCFNVNARAAVILSDSTDRIVGIGIRSSELDGLCAVFFPCVPISFADSLRIQSQSLFESLTLDGRFQENGVVYANIYYDNDLIVRNVSLGTILPSGRDRRDQLESLLMSAVERYFQAYVMGTSIRKEALSYPGGRTDGTQFLDGYADVETHSMNGLSMTEPRHGRLLLRLEFVVNQGELKMNRLAMASVIIRP